MRPMVPIRTARRRGALVAALACGLSLALAYIFTVGYAAPRFLLPAYALLAIIGMLCYFVVQARSLYVNSRQIHAARAVTAEAASRLHHLGLRPPCFLYGHDAVQIAYLARCARTRVFKNYGGALSVPSSIRAAMSRGDRVGVLTTSRKRL
ncbi:hypothetical protein [Nonomuraea sp. NPDC049480]|uniref:hypothetical protein n=1 Tax=Nonomuraea sp. NPDC049480 TaxID=3364353 RepID=UPI00379F142B